MSHRLPETMSRIEVCSYLQGLRQHFALSEQDVSDRLHIRVRYVRAMEAADFAQLPGDVYARGYLHTYAEFLGLDADQVVGLCFGAQAEATPPTAPTPHATRVDATKWRASAVLLMLAMIAVLVVVQLRRHPAAEAPETVAPVPQAMLESLRTMMMPLAANAECFAGEAWSACLRSSREWRVLAALEYVPTHYAAERNSLAATDEAPETAHIAATDEKKPAEAVIVKPAAKPKKKARAKATHADEIAAPPAHAEPDHNLLPEWMR